MAHKFGIVPTMGPDKSESEPAGISYSALTCAASQTGDISLPAVDIRALSARIGTIDTSIACLRAMRISELPVTGPIVPVAGSSSQAVLSWRWDVNDRDGISRNLAAAVLHAIRTDVQHLFIDKVSIDQKLSGIALMDVVGSFSRLFGSIPTFAAHDIWPTPDDDRHFLRTLRRPWIAMEILRMRGNECGIDYVGHLSDQGVATEFGFVHMVNRIWSTSFANSLLYVLTGFSSMHDMDELPLLLVDESAWLSEATCRMARPDALLAAAIVAQMKFDDDRVNGDLDIRDQPFEAFRFERIDDSLGFWCNWHVKLGDQVAATWSEKNYTRDGMHRRKLTPAVDVRQTICRHIGFDEHEIRRMCIPEPLRNELGNERADVRLVDLSSDFRAAGWAGGS